jgi:hypothetical protein
MSFKIHYLSGMCLAVRSGSAVGVGQDQSTLLLLRLRDAVRVVRFLIWLFNQHYLHFVHLAKFTTTVYMKSKKNINEHCTV